MIPFICKYCGIYGMTLPKTIAIDEIQVMTSTKVISLIHLPSPESSMPKIKYRNISSGPKLDG